MKIFGRRESAEISESPLAIKYLHHFKKKQMGWLSFDENCDPSWMWECLLIFSHRKIN